MVKTIGIIAIKGGVGKTSISASLASDLVNRHRKKVLLVDANYSAPNLGLHMDILEPARTIHDVLAGKTQMKNAIHTRYGVDVIPGNFVYTKKFNPLKLKNKLKKFGKNYDYVIIDSSPSLNDEILSTMTASDDLFVVTTPDYPTLSCSLKAASLAKKKGCNIAGIILNKVRNPKYEINLHEIEKAVGIPVVANIQDDKNHVKSVFTRIPASIYSKRSKFSRELGKLSDAIAGERTRRGLFESIFPGAVKKEAVNRQILRRKFYNSMFEDE